MKLGISALACHSGWSAEKIYATASRLGYDGVEWWLGEAGPVNVNSSKEDMQKLKAIAEEHGMQTYSLACGMYWGCSLTSNSQQIRKEAKAILKKQIELAHYLGCESILVVPGAVGVDFVPNCEVVDYIDAYNRAVEWVDEYKEYAKQLNIEIAVENVWNKFLLSPIEMRDFIDRAESEFVGSYFDVGNVLYSGYPEQWIRILGSRIKKVHLKDFSRAIGTLSGFVNLLKGDVDYPAVMAALREVGYDGWLTAELFFDETTCEAGLEETITAMKKITSE